VIFDGTSIGADAAAFSGFSVKTEPVKVTVTTMDGRSYPGEYIGFDRFSGIGFMQMKAEGVTFTPVKFREDHLFRIGEWLGLYMLLPEYVSPPLAADVGMVSALVTSPEEFALTVGSVRCRRHQCCLTRTLSRWGAGDSDESHGAERERGNDRVVRSDGDAAAGRGQCESSGKPGGVAAPEGGVGSGVAGDYPSGSDKRHE